MTCKEVSININFEMGFLNDLTVLTNKKKQNELLGKESVTPPKKILIVEDEASVAEVLESKLRTVGYDVIKAENGAIGLEVVSSQKPQLVILDLLMPIMDGKTMLRRLRDIPEFKTLPVIILTQAGTIENMRETHMYYNAVLFLVKSNIVIEGIVEYVRQVI